ncbi:PepSY domain-containing protein [Fibrisoma montanum]|uniref:PepSY domain-containing protein n=1 Tax=Fibrisoma montanum TaxID=2305895 RepID=A0A418M0N0_9BACT|nr:PepSY-associated TM helix domain-containing protein [Fibrisoma montanum]RIV19038.1 PepSY domain-containing protein [Fibrisoma montanum]
MKFRFTSILILMLLPALVHPSTGDLFHQDRQEDKTLGATWRNSNYAIHVGSIYGLPTKLLASFVALFLASLPVTGFLIWWGRRKKAAKAVMRRATLMNQNYSAN